tara:strand:- start:170 stop:382 length:213 start_codon:yes stop_codon:yes gene_type:complete
MNTTEQIDAFRSLGIHKWPSLRINALKLAMQESAPRPEFRDHAKIASLVFRWKIGTALAYYVENPTQFWT